MNSPEESVGHPDFCSVSHCQVFNPIWQKKKNINLILLGSTSAYIFQFFHDMLVAIKFQRIFLLLHCSGLHEFIFSGEEYHERADLLLIDMDIWCRSVRFSLITSNFAFDYFRELLIVERSTVSSLTNPNREGPNKKVFS